MSIDNDNKWVRPLVFPLKESYAPDKTDEADGSATVMSIDLFPVDIDERIDIVLNVSFREFTTLASAIDIGRDIGYGDQSALVWWIWVRALQGLAMDCDGVADCIETSASVLSALLAQLANNGFVPSGNSVSADEMITLPQTQLDSNFLPEGYDCSNPASDMAISRAIVRELHETFNDFLDELELVTNTVEAANIMTDGTPIFGALNNVTELANWFLEVAAETYQAAYDQSFEDTASCMIFCELQDTCEISINRLLELYVDTFGLTEPTSIDNFQDIGTWIIGIASGANDIFAGHCHLLLLMIMRFGAGAFGISWNGLQNTIRNAAEWRDFSYDDCSCPPTVPTKNFWRIYKDFALDENGWVHDNNNGEYIPGSGIQSRVGLSTGAVTVVQIPDIGLDSAAANWKIKALFQENYVADPNNSGSQDFCSQEGWSGANFTGTLSSLGNATLGVSSYKPATYRGNTAGASFFNGRSFRFTRAARGGTSNLTTLVARLTRVVIIGLPGTSGDKPALAEWWRDTLPATAQEFFDD